MRLLQIFFVKNQKREEERRRESVREGKSGVLSCMVILCDKLRCHIMSGGLKTRGFCHDRIEVIPFDKIKVRSISKIFALRSYEITTYYIHLN
jgi:hypothetical protein